jgi:hypothetical protein
MHRTFWIGQDRRPNVLQGARRKRVGIDFAEWTIKITDYFTMNEKKIKGRFEKGNKARLGSKNPKAGRSPDWLKAECDKILDRCKLFEFLGAVVAGEPVERESGEDGGCLLVAASVRDRLKAAEMLLDRRFGRPTQAVEHSGTVSLEQLVCGEES